MKVIHILVKRSAYHKRANAWINLPNFDSSPLSAKGSHIDEFYSALRYDGMRIILTLKALELKQIKD